MKSAIRLSGVCKSYRQQFALIDVSLDVPSGVVFALLGENGAGKSTAIRILLGLETPDFGQATVLGLDSVRDGEAIRHRIGYVAERPTLYDWMTVDEIGWFTAGFHTNGFLKNYRELATRFELPSKRKLKRLSKGMYAKVALSLALAHEPELLVLDEPTSGLDTMVRREFLESMVDWAAEGRTVLIASHQISEVERVADYVAMVRHGQLVLLERLDELKRSIVRLTVTLADQAELPPIAGEVIEEHASDRQRRLIVRDMDPPRIEALREHDAVREVTAEPASLEEIYIAYMHRDT